MVTVVSPFLNYVTSLLWATFAHLVWFDTNGDFGNLCQLFGISGEHLGGDVSLDYLPHGY